MEPVSYDALDHVFDGLTPDLSALPNQRRFEFTHWWEHPEDRLEDVPLAIDNNGGTVAGLWDASREWILVGHEFCRAGCAGVIGAVSIFNPETGSNREISDCGGHPSCVGWLPDNVDVKALAPGRSVSVLPAPVSIEYGDSPTVFSRHFQDAVSHKIECNPENQRREFVTNITTGAIDFILPVSEWCGYPIERAPVEIYESEPVVFAVSPDAAYYAVTDYTKYTSLYDALTGDLIVTLNFYGEELSFSDDSRYLLTRCTAAIGTWDIQSLIANHGGG